MDSPAFITKFIEFVEKEPVLWDKTNKLYDNSNAQNSAWEFIALKLNESFEKEFVTGASLSKLWSSLLTIHNNYLRNPSSASLDYAENLKFLGKPKTDYSLFLKKKKAFYKHLLSNIFFVCVTILMVNNGTFMQKGAECTKYNEDLIKFWCISTGLATLVALITSLKDIQLWKNVLPILIIICYAAIFIINLMVNDMHPRRDHSYTTNCADQYSCSIILAGVGFPVASLLSFGYHFIKVSKKSALTSSVKTVSAAYFGSALLFFCFIEGIKWNYAFFLLVVWLTVNAKFSIDAVRLSWKMANPAAQNSYSVSWNASSDQFEVVLNGTNQIPDILVVPSEKVDQKSMKYSKNFMNKFIAFVEREPILWDKSNEHYGNSNAVNEAWEYTALKLNEFPDGGFTTGVCLSELWSSLVEIHKEMCENPRYVNFEHMDKLEFLGKPKKKVGKKNIKGLPQPVEHRSDILLVKQVLSNIAFIILYFVFATNGVFSGTYIDCHHAVAPVFMAWCAVTGISAIVTLFIVIKDYRVCKFIWLIVVMSAYGAVGAGSAVTFVFFIAAINWHITYFFFFLWILVIAKFSTDAKTYSVTWNKKTNQFEITSTGPASKLSETVIYVFGADVTLQ